MTGRRPAVEFEALGYRLEVSEDGRWALLSDTQGRLWARLCLMAAVDCVDGPDETLSVSAPRASRSADGTTVITVGRRSSRWAEAGTRLECRHEEILLTAYVEGEGHLTDVSLLGGRSLMPECMGRLHSGSVLPSLFSPNPEDPRQVLRSGGKPAVIGVTGDSLPGRGHWFFTPAPLFFALGDGTFPSPGAGGDSGPEPGPGPSGEQQGWLGLGLVAEVGDMGFTEMAYVPADEGFHLELRYEGHQRVRGLFQAPGVVLMPGVPEPYAGLAGYRRSLAGPGRLPAPRAAEPPRWWSHPMFCGWGAQCYLAKLAGTSAAEQCSGANYERFLGELSAHGLTPPTVVIDDGWQAEYGRPDPHPARWPDLKAWVAERHRRGQHVLLWWKAWDVSGVPPEWCIRNQAGAPVAVDPGLAEVRQFMEDSVAQLLSPAGLDADGLKVDFTARTPSGYGVSASAGGKWGVALLHQYLHVLYQAAKAAKPDALVITHTPNPAFGDVCDMLRLNDMLRLDEANPESPVVTQMRYRAAVARSACPDLLIDTDDWCAPNLEQWRAYLAVKREIGVPALYYTTHLDRTGEAFEEQDYAALRALWGAAGAPPAAMGGAPTAQAAPPGKETYFD